MCAPCSMLGQTKGHIENSKCANNMLCKLKLLQGAVFSILKGIKLIENFIMFSSLLVGGKSNAFGDSNNRDYTNKANFLIFPFKYKPCLHSCNQGRKHSLPGMMILWFLKEVHTDKSEYSYLRGV